MNSQSLDIVSFIEKVLRFRESRRFEQVGRPGGPMSTMTVTGGVGTLRHSIQPVHETQATKLPLTRATEAKMS